MIECSVHAESELALIKFRFATAHYGLKCSLFDIPSLDAVASLCHSTNITNPIKAPARSNSTSAFGAGIHAVLASDSQVDPAETEWLCHKNADPGAIEQGAKEPGKLSFHC
ncbi:MAG: hypothetical protein CMO80_22875 [Verrucomicrobiales bacterium]|nr:hypothetical protein [Verrucomicrobiales bacterium]